jgi:polyhydroxyalkanoate synthesis regulator phasin
MKYWDVRGREVDKDDRWTSMANHSVPAAPWIQQVAIADRTNFNPIMKELREKGASVWTFDWNGDTKPEFAIRIDFTISNTIRAYNVTTSDNKNVKKFDFHFIQDDAWKYGYQGNTSPRRQKDDFFDFLGDILTSKTTWEMAITMIPVVGEIVLLGEALTGYTIFGDKMSTAERIVAGLAALLPVAAGVVAKGMARGGADLAKVAAKVGRSEEEVMALLRAAEKQGTESAAVKNWSATLKASGKLTAEEATKLQRMIRQIEADERAFRAEAQAARRATQSGEKQAATAALDDAAKLGRTVSEQSVQLLGQSHTLRVVDQGNGVFSLILCSDCGFVLKEIDSILAQTSAKGPTKSLRVRLERLRTKVADLEAKMASGAIKQTDGVAKLDQIATHLGDIAKKFPSANKLCVFCSFKGQLDYDLMAKNLGFERTGARSHGQPVYRRGNEFISPDVDRHNGGIWKKASGDEANLRNKILRDGTFNEDLTKKVGL